MARKPKTGEHTPAQNAGVRCVRGLRHQNKSRHQNIELQSKTICAFQKLNVLSVFLIGCLFQLLFAMVEFHQQEISAKNFVNIQWLLDFRRFEVWLIPSSWTIETTAGIREVKGTFCFFWTGPAVLAAFAEEILTGENQGSLDGAHSHRNPRTQTVESHTIWLSFCNLSARCF